ncbi:hypothetical protein [Rugamonas aquatica]|uniref:Uncharacterized protein n=1 Tax=Rugamonas aquatica TaxID=2743357 RepID=A0A6A7N6S0_9BURK|nr:hypothetical protein [Rugamonas aquatica]MQA40804.1 hypothetical protein [Rugamonas aquatica]
MKKCLCVVVAGLNFLTVANAAQPVRLQLPLPVAGTRFLPHNIGFSADGKDLCLAGTNTDENGRATAQLLLIDRTSSTVRWQKRLPAPDGHSDIYPVQCVKDGGAVYLLANVDTDSVKSLRHTLAYVYSFNLQGKQTGYKVLDLPGSDHFAYAMAATPGGIKVAGYIKDEDDDFEYYSVFTQGMDAALKADKPSIKKTGAFAPFPSGRIVGDSLHIAGNFYPYKLSKKEGDGDYAVSKLRLNGSYLWSQRPPTANSLSGYTGVGANGSVFRLAYQKETSSLLQVTPDGKFGPEVSYASKYCETRALVEYGNDYLAIRKPCNSIGGRSVMVSINPESKTEKLLDWLAEEPLYLTADPDSWAVVGKDKSGKPVLYTGAVKAAE